MGSCTAIATNSSMRYTANSPRNECAPMRTISCTIITLGGPPLLDKADCILGKLTGVQPWMG